MWRGLLVAGTASLLGLVNGLASTDTITWGGDNSRAGYLTTHNMDPAIVGSSQFGLQWQTKLPGNYGGEPEQIYSQPLVYTPSGSDRQFVYWSTTQNNVYKVDAKTGEIIASRNLHIPFLRADLEDCADIQPHVGIIGTGVIDPETETLYIAAKTYANQAVTGAQGRPNGRYYIHALDVNDLSERPNFPIGVHGMVADNNPGRVFASGDSLQRPGLLHQGDYIFIAFGSHCVKWDFSGWIVGFHKTTAKFTAKFATQGEGVADDVEGAGIWMSGGGLSSDNAGSIYFATGNGYASQLSTIPVSGFDPPTSLEEAIVRLNLADDGSVSVVDFFMPWEKQQLDGADDDLGTSPIQILPSETFSCGDVRRMGIITGKTGKTYFVNLDNLGGYRNGASGLDAVVQVYAGPRSVYSGAGVYPLEGGYIYISPTGGNPTHVFSFSCENGQAKFTRVAESENLNAVILGVSHGTVTSLDNQPGTGLLWITDRRGDSVRVYDAVPRDDGKLNQIKGITVEGVAKFSRAVFGDGMMYLGSVVGNVYGFGAPNNPPLVCGETLAFGTVDASKESATKEVTCKATIGLTVDKVSLNTGTHYVLSGLPDGKLTLAAGKSFTFNVQFAPKRVGLHSDSVKIATSNNVEGYSTTTSIRLSGTGESTNALLSVSPASVTFSDVISGDGPSDRVENIVLSNEGNSALTVQSVSFSESADGTFEKGDGKLPLRVGKFIVRNMPNTIAATSRATLNIEMDATESGNFTGAVRISTNGGEGSFTMRGSAGPAPVAVIEFQSIGGEEWVKYKQGVPFSFGNVTQNTALARRMRITNAAPKGGVSLTLTVSKPPFGGSGLIRAANQVDLAEGTKLLPGESETAVLTCSAPKSQWNMDVIKASATWTLNLNDPSFEKNVIEFACNGVSQQAPPLLYPGYGQYRYLGCFKENNPGRQLQSQIYGSDENTNAMCIDRCHERGWIFCATQYHRECWGGNVIPRQRVADMNCNYECEADVNQWCGGNGEGANAGGSYMSLFADSLEWDGNYTNPNPPTDPTDPPGPQPSDPVANPGVDGYAHLGCYTEATTGRALPNGKSMESATVANCVKACAADNYVYAGLEYSQECWCGNKLGIGSVEAPAKECNLACKGNPAELCGGGARLNVYKLSDDPPSSGTSSGAVSQTSATVTGTVTVTTETSSEVATTTTKATSTTTTTTQPVPTNTNPVEKATVGDYDSLGCYIEVTTGRALTPGFLADDNMTLEMCAEFCDAYTYFGVQYGRECRCGNVLKEGSIPAQKQSDCSFPCPGDKRYLCGAGMRYNMYIRGGSESISSPSPAPETVPPTESATASRSTTGTTTKTTTPAQPSSTVKSSTTTKSTSTTTRASSSTVKPSTTTTTKTSTTTTKTTTTSAKPSATGPVVWEGNKNFTYYSCVSEPSAGRLLPNQVHNNGTHMTPALCVEKCSKYNYAGVEYGRECWCGDKLDLAGNTGATPGKNVTDDKCSFECPGDKGVRCGAGGHMSLYVLRALVREMYGPDAA